MDEDDDDLEKLNENNIDRYGIKYELKGEEATLVMCTNKEIEVMTISSVVKKDNTLYIVTRIGDVAFFRCSKLRGGLKIPEGVTEIGEYAFARCSGLTKIRVPKGAKIGKDAFSSGVEIEEYEVETRECEVEENNCCRI